MTSLFEIHLLGGAFVFGCVLAFCLLVILPLAVLGSGPCCRAMLALAVALAVSPAMAQTDKLGFPCDLLKLKPGCRYVPPPGATATPQALDVWKNIAAAALPDLEYAKALSAAAGTPASGVRGQCWDALIVANKRAVGSTVAGDKPDPHLATDAEQFAELLDDLDPKGPLFVACAGTAQLFKLQVLQLINALVTGAVGLAAAGVT